MRDSFQKKMLAAVTVFTLLYTIVFSSSSAFAETNATLDIEAEAAILVEAESGKILYEKNLDTSLPIASMTKMMTEYLVHEAIDTGKVTWDQKATVSEYAYIISQDRSLSNVALEKGGSYSVKELYEAMAIHSANGATIALAELISGSEGNFVKLMNDKAKEIGLTNSSFVNTTGLTNKDLKGYHSTGQENDENLMSARDSAILAQRLILDYPDILATAKIPKKVFQEGGKYPQDMPNWNWMLPGLVYQYEGVDGLKTGSTPAAGYCFTGTAMKNGMRLITVVIKTDSYKKRFDETAKLLNYGFNGFEVKELYPEGTEPDDIKAVTVAKGKEKEVSIQTNEAVVIAVPKGKKDAYTATVQLDADEVVAPVEEGTKVGYMAVKAKESNDPGFLYGNELKAELVTNDSVEKANWFILAVRGVGSFFSHLWTGTIDTVKGWF